MISAQRLRIVHFGWPTLLHVAAIGNLAALLSLALFNRDQLAIVLAAIVLLGLLLRQLRSGILGSLVLTGALADQSIYTVVGAITNVLHGEGPRAVFMPAFIAATAVAGLIAAVATIIWRHNPAAGQRVAPRVAQAVSLFFVLLLYASVFTAQDGSAAAPSDIVLHTANMAYSQSALVAESGTVTLELSNDDLFWHTFTVDELAVDLLVTENGTRQVTFEAPPGSYYFYCAIPGHATLGMTGTLTVEAATTENEP